MSNNKSPYNSKYKQGIYIPQNKEKYFGTEIKFRSSLEYAFCVFLDLNERILKWSSENPIIIYQTLDSQTHRYYPDFYYEMMTDNDPNKLKRVVVEIKPKSELYPPVKPLNETFKSLSNYEYSVKMHVKNKLKWNAAEEYCKSRGMEFVIITDEILKNRGIIK